MFLQEGFNLNVANANATNEICVALYDTSAKCNQYLGLDDTYEVSN